MPMHAHDDNVDSIPVVNQRIFTAFLSAGDFFIRQGAVVWNTLRPMIANICAREIRSALVPSRSVAAAYTFIIYTP